MSGHSKWASIKHKKKLVDSKRGKVFTKIIKEITIAARQSGGKPESNPRLRSAIESAKEANMPADNIKKAVARGTGEIPGVNYEETSYEGYGPGGGAVYVTVATDNKNRTSSEVRSIFAKHGGNMGESGCVSWIFQSKGVITVLKKDMGEDRMMSLAIDAGAEDISTEDGDAYEITTAPENFDNVKKAISKEVHIASAELTMLPSSYVNLQGGNAQKALGLLQELEEHDDIKDVFANYDIQDAE